MAKADIGLIGLAVMGQNLVLNMNDHGFTVAVFNRTVSKVDDFLSQGAKGTRIRGAHSLRELVGMLKRPRRVMLLVQAGPAVDDFIKKLIPLLEKGDVIIDGGNSNYHDTIRRTTQVEVERAPLHRHRRFGRRGGGATRPLDHARRIACRVAARKADLPGDRGQGGRRALLRLGRRKRRGALRQDGA